VLTVSFFVENINPIQKNVEASLDVKTSVYNSALFVCVLISRNQNVGEGHNKRIRNKSKETEAKFL
jgi:hypothetical protein